MIKHFVEDLPTNSYDQKLEELSKIFDVAPYDVVSLKIRPVRVNLNQYENAYASGWDNQDFREYLENNKENFDKIETDYTSALIETKAGGKIIYIEHETGPELVFETFKVAADITTIIGFVLSIIRIFKKNDDKHYKKEHGQNRIRAISIEKRKKGKRVKIIKIIQIENADKLETEKDIKKMLRRLK
ncbi:hypothetical protein CLV31_109145 [Algoriphagus aquaeductus]|uniref:Uncharacterized protein n=1 Tax=Algoriphagus aquaeductus TaxID=475299 RepID=A0A326RPM7_9BACT|nr:hypothetical protein [Algoriphagus aquaeductus]PZV82284.1 hypothetical protein CLV31_109145 [Algoriphagus aquaeductus]